MQTQLKLEQLGLHHVTPSKLSATAIHTWKYLILSNFRSQAGAGMVSTAIGDGVGIPCAVAFLLFMTIICCTITTLNEFLVNTLLFVKCCKLFFSNETRKARKT